MKSINYVTIFDVEFHHFPLELLDNKAFQRAFWLGIQRVVDNYRSDKNRENVNVGFMISDRKMSEDTSPLTIYMVCKKNGSYSQSLFDEFEEALMFEIADHLEDTIMRYGTHKHSVVPFAKLPKLS